MKVSRYFPFACGLCTVLFFTNLSAQQNLFNVPNGQITQRGRVFVQEQINASASSIQSNTTFDYGIGYDTEVGLNIFFLNFSPRAPLKNQSNSTDETFPMSPLILANVQKGFKISESFHASAGGQAGGNAGDPERIRFAYLTYGTFAYREMRTQVSLHFGIYRGNVFYNGTGDGFLMGGFEFPIIRDKFHILGDIIQGAHANAVMVPGLLWYVTENLGLSIGWQKPFPNSQTEQAIVFELSFL